MYSPTVHSVRPHEERAHFKFDTSDNDHLPLLQFFLILLISGKLKVILGCVAGCLIIMTAIGLIVFFQKRYSRQ